MTDAPGSLAAESWAFALQLYAEPGVREACLHLQDQGGVDVMLLLVAVFAASRKHMRLSAEDVSAMDDACRPWRAQVVAPLRALRRTLASGPAPAPSQASERLRAQIKAAELDAERLENDLLAAWLASKTPGKVELRRVEISDVIRAVVRSASGDEGDLSSAIGVISDAAETQSATDGSNQSMSQDR
jgi:uncharacterized protein (TIGR02444 family)